MSVPVIVLLSPELLATSAALPTVAPCLHRLLCRARRAMNPIDDPCAPLFALFGIPLAPGHDPPVAAVGLLAEGRDPEEGFWLCADPVRLVADQNGLFLFPVAADEFDAARAQHTATRLDEVFKAHGLRLQTPAPRRWYLRADAWPAIRTTSLPCAIGRDVRELLPQGDDRHFWHRLLTECQMVLHDDASGSPSAPNSVWFWGAGKMPAVAAATSPGPRVFGNDTLCKGLATLTHASCAALPDKLPDAMDKAGEEGAEHLFILAATDDYRSGPALGAQDSHAALTRLERDWFAPLHALLRSGRLPRLTILIGRCRFTLRRASLWQFWRTALPRATVRRGGI